MFRDEWPRLIGAALRFVGDLQTAEDVVQETLLVAVDRWPLQGVPERPGAWLMTACRNRARNVARDTTVAQRIVRAKRTLKQHRVVFTGEDPDLPARLPSILDVIYLVFNEGYLASAGETLTRGDLAFEAYRLACLLTELTPADPEPWALRALLAFQLSRWATRTGDDGALRTLDTQDRTRWNHELIAEGLRALDRARAGARAGLRDPLLIQAELAACHATAATFGATDWPAIVALYDELRQIQDTPVVALNRAVAVAMPTGLTPRCPCSTS